MASHRVSEQKVWDFFVTLFNGNEYAAAGACGNMQHESGLYTDNCENSWNDQTGISDTEATQYINDGTWNLNHFLYGSNTATSPLAGWWVNRYGWGYGLSQWTTTDRRTELWNRTIAIGLNIDDEDAQLGYINAEFNGGWSDVKQDMINSTSVEEATRIYCTEYEKGSWSSNRLTYANYFYNTYAGSTGSGYLTSFNIEGNGSATATPLRAQQGSTVQITAFPNGSDTFIGFTVVSGGVTLTTTGANTATFTMGNSNVVIKAEFTGTTPTPPSPPQPVIYPNKLKKRHMPIWMYPMFR